MKPVSVTSQLNISFTAFRRSKPPAYRFHARHMKPTKQGAIFIPCIVSGYLMRQRIRNAKLVLLDATNQQGGSKSRACSEWRNGRVSLDKPGSHCWYSGRLMEMMSEKAEFNRLGEALYRNSLG